MCHPTYVKSLKALIIFVLMKFGSKGETSIDVILKLGAYYEKGHYKDAKK